MRSNLPRTDEEWRKRLTPEQYNILRQAGTEPAFSGALVHNKDEGTYACGGCGAELFVSRTKYDSQSGWPSFTEPSNPEVLELRPDTSHGMHRVEARCKRCGSHLGHVFDDGPRPTGQRYCINSLSLDFMPAVEKPASDPSN